MQKIKTATITFHASHNYGSMLQAYALQSILLNDLGVENEIINFRSEIQKKCYPFPSLANVNLIRRIVRQLSGYNEGALVKKYQLFESFLANKLNISQEFNDETDVVKYAENFDFLISGSDQIWNTNCADFSWLYFLPFAKNNAIAYAPSMGPCGRKAVKEEFYTKISECLQRYKAISVREEGTAEIIKRLSSLNVDTLVDPTLLVDYEVWNNLSGDSPIVDGDYIFMYHPFMSEDFCRTSRKIAKITGLPIVVSNKLPSYIELYNKLPFTTKITSKLDCGPIEFLNLIKNARLVISGSFHAVVFSIIFNRPFLAIGGKTDNRMSHLLRATGLLDYGVSDDDFISALNKIAEIKFEKAKSYIELEKEKSVLFLKNSFKK